MILYNKKKSLMDEIDTIMPSGKDEKFDNWLVEVESMMDYMIDEIESLKDEIEMINDNS
jgi:hypothetical protein